MKFRTRIILYYLGIVALAILSFALFFLRPEEARLERDFEATLAIQARQMAAATRLGPGGPLWTAELGMLAKAARVRLTLIAPDGRVIGDSRRDPAIMENHAGRPEVKAALSGTMSKSRRYSKTLRVQLIYIAVPLRQSGRIAGVARVAKAQREVAAALWRLRRTFALGALIAALPALIFGTLAVSKMTRPLLALEDAARRLGSGDFKARVREFGLDELGLLARTFNRMAGQLDRLVANLSEERGRVYAILAALADGVIVFDQRQRVTLANSAAGRFLGLDPEKMAGRTPAELLLPPAAVESIARAAKEHAGGEIELELHLPARRRLLLSLAPVRDTESRLQGTLAVLRDLTTLRHLERVRQDFVANVSHELKTPLAAMKAMAETLQEEGIDPGRRRGFLASIDADCDRLNALVGDLLTLAMLDDGGIVPREEVFALDGLVREVAARLFPEGAARRPEFEPPPDLPPVKADPERVRQVLINLLDNAAKYSPDDAPFGVRAAAGGDWVTVTVWDRGPGIPPAESERIFERFYRLDKARSRALGGTGLGLSIVKHLVESWGGRVWVENRDGAEFHFTVPRAE